MPLVKSDRENWELLSTIIGKNHKYTTPYGSFWSCENQKMSNTLTFIPQCFTTAEYFHIKDYYFPI